MSARELHLPVASDRASQTKLYAEPATQGGLGAHRRASGRAQLALSPMTGAHRRGEHLSRRCALSQTSGTEVTLRRRASPLDHNPRGQKE